MLAAEGAYSREENADGACRDAIRGVEAALKPIVSPKQTVTTLGTIIGDIGSNSAKFQLRLEAKDDPVLSFVSILSTVWTAQLARHGVDDESTPLGVSVEQARDAIALAATVASWAQTGAFRRI